MKTLEITKATAPLADYAQGLEQDPIILTIEGKPVAALISIENLDWESISLSQYPRFIEIIERSRARQREEGGISSEEMRHRLGLQKSEETTQ